MDASNSVDFDTDFFKKYAAIEYYLSKGAYGIVYGPIPWKDQQLAFKQVLFANGKSTEQIRNDIEEKQQIWASLEHKHLMRILSVDLSQLPKVMYIVMEFAAGGSLYDTLRSMASKKMKLAIDVLTDWTRQIAEGMLYLHQKNIVHRDLKSSNILLMQPFNPHKIITLKITDFDEVREHDHTTTMTFVGTCAYMAPEVLLKERFSKASDVWSFGVLIWEMLSGDIPRQGQQASEIIAKSARGELDGLFIEPSFPEDCKAILEKCWKSTSEERISFKEILDFLDSIAITELTVLHKEVFIQRYDLDDIEVYDSNAFKFKRRIKVDGMTNPGSLISCSAKFCVYVVDKRYQKLHPAILRIEPTNGNLIKAWKIPECVGQLSVSSDTNVILCAACSRNMYEYTADGELVRTINLDRESSGLRTRNITATHAVKLNSGFFVVCDYDGKEVYLLSTKETSGTSKRIDEVQILQECSRQPGVPSNSLKFPEYLSVSKEGTLLISRSYFGRQALLLSPKFDEARILVSEFTGNTTPSWKTCFDESTGNWFISNGRHILLYRVEGEVVKHETYYLKSNEIIGIS